MRRLVFALGFAMTQPALADWLPLTGTPGDSSSDSIQVDPTSLRTEAGLKFVNVRVSRSTQRVSQDGVAFRSYEATAAINCLAHSARYTWARFFDKANFQGEIVNERTYHKATVRPVQFLGIPGNYLARLIRATCGTHDLGAAPAG